MPQHTPNLRRIPASFFDGSSRTVDNYIIPPQMVADLYHDIRSGRYREHVANNGTLRTYIADWIIRNHTEDTNG